MGQCEGGRFTAAELRRLRYARFLVRAGLLSDHVAGGGAGDGGADPPGPPLGSCRGCPRPLTPIWYGPPDEWPSDHVFGGHVGYPDAPAYFCEECRRYYDAAGGPYCGRSDPLELH
jgi:hypothetical protein